MEHTAGRSGDTLRTPAVHNGASCLAHVPYPQFFANTVSFSVPGGASGKHGWFRALQLSAQPLSTARQWHPVLHKIQRKHNQCTTTSQGAWGRIPVAPAAPSRQLPTTSIPSLSSDPSPHVITPGAVIPWQQQWIYDTTVPAHPRSTHLHGSLEWEANTSTLPATVPPSTEQVNGEEGFLDEADGSSSSSEEFEVHSDSSEEWGAPRRRRKKRRSNASTVDIDRPFKCTHPRCKKVYSRKTDLQIHERNHTGERPFPCTHPGCSRAFKSKAVMVTHLRLHTGEKPFACPVPGCGGRFIQRSNYSRHMQLHAVNPGVIRITTRFHEEGAGTPSDAEQ